VCLTGRKFEGSVLKNKYIIGHYVKNNNHAIVTSSAALSDAKI